MRLLACLIVAPQRGYDEPAILSYAISSFCPTSAGGLHPLLALFGKQVAFTAVYVQVLEHGAPAPQMLNSLIIRRIRTLDE
jgi:hypothetical protein